VGELRIGATEVIAAGFVSAVIDRISRRYPRIAFDVRKHRPSTAGPGTTRPQHQISLSDEFPDGFVDEEVDTEILFDEPVFVVVGTPNPWGRRIAA